MKSIKQQYIDLMEGRMSQHNFMRSLRMTMPQYVTNVTSFKDSVRILKNKGILSEAYANEAPSYDYNGKKLYVDNQSGEPDAPGGKVSLYDEEENEYIGTISSIDREGFISVDPESIQPANGEDEDAEFIDMIAKAEEEEAGKYTKFDDFEGGLSEAKKKKEPKAEMHPNQIHPQELRMGIKVELEHTDDLDKAKKIALDHLAENPFYYTALKLSGIESPSAPKAKYPVEKKTRKKKEAVEMVDAANQMQKVKMPKVVKENLNEGGEYMFSGTLTGQETADLKKMIPGVEIEEEELDDTYKTVISHSMYNEKTLRHAVRQVMGQLPSAGDKKDLGASFDKFKSQLESLVREVLDEMYDGRDNLDEDGGFEQWKQALYKIVMEKAKLEADEIAIDDAEIKQYYQKGKTPEEVYFDIWQQDAGNFFSISF